MNINNIKQSESTQITISTKELDIDLRQASSQLIHAKVIESKLDGYFLQLFGKRIFVQSKFPLFPNEILTLKLSPSTKNTVHLTLLNRFTDSSPSTDGNFELLKNLLMSTKFNVFEFLESIASKSEIQSNKIFQLLFLYFPQIEWMPETNYFYWTWEDFDSEGFLGKRKDTKVFSLNLKSVNFGNMKFLFLWKDKDMEDLSIIASFEQSDTYNLFHSKSDEFVNLFKKNGLKLNRYVFLNSNQLEIPYKEWSA